MDRREFMTMILVAVPLAAETFSGSCQAIIEAGRAARGTRQARSKRAALEDWAEDDLEEGLRTAFLAETLPPALPGTPWPRRRLSAHFPTNDRDRRACEEVDRFFNGMAHSLREFPGRMKLLARCVDGL